MDLLLVALILLVLFASISVVGALHRIRDASEKSVRLLEEHLAKAARESPTE